jgi:cytochrome c-type biogenesis protein CcmE
MDPASKRKIRLIVALSAAVLLAVALIHASFSASSETKQPSEILNASPGSSYDLTGVVVPGSIHHRGSELDFRVAGGSAAARNAVESRSAASTCGTWCT